MVGLSFAVSAAIGAIAGILVGTGARLVLHFAIPEELRGWDTMLAPLIGLVAFVAVAIATGRSAPPRHEALEYVPSEEELISGRI